MTRNELIESLEGTITKVISLRLALDDGDLIFTSTMIYFIAERMDQWTIIEEWEQTGISRWKLQESFIGLELAIYTLDGRFLFRKIPAEINWAQLFTESTEYKTVQPKIEIKRGETQESETERNSRFFYGNVAEEAFDMLSKHEEQVDPKNVMDLDTILAKKKERLQKKEQRDSIHNTSQKPVQRPKESFGKTTEPPEKKKNSCVGCIFALILIFFLAPFLGAILSEL